MNTGKISRRYMLKWGAGIAGSLVLLRAGFPSRGNSKQNLIEKDKPTVINDLITRTIPSSGEKLPVIGMGTWLTFDVGNSESERKIRGEVLKTFTELGGKLIDSSPMYGSSEKVVGDLADDLHIKNKLFYATKVWTNGEQNGIEQMRQSFQKMKTGKMDLMQVHNLVDADAHLKTLRKWKADGLIRYIGITHYISSAYPDLMRIIKKDKPDFVQFNYNIQVRDAEKVLLPFCKDNGIAVINNRPFDGGSLFGLVNGKALPAWAKELGINNWAQYFLKYIASHSAVTCAIPATSKVQHMKENMGAAYGPLPDEAFRKKMVDYFDKM